MAATSAYQARVLRWCHACAIAGCIAIVVAALYVGQVILMPFALAIVLSFLLHPVVRLLERVGLWRVPAVIAVVLAVGCLFGGIGWHVMLQLQSLARELHRDGHYVANLEEKIENLRGLGSEGMWTDFQAVIDRFSKEIEVDEAAPGQPAPVTVQAVQPSPWASLYESVEPFLESLGTAALVAALLIFMLLDREDLRNRIIGLFGHKRLAVTTHAIDDAAHRIGRYLLMQFLINGSYGLVLTIALWMTGVPFAFLWGLLAAIFRYIPYVGPWLGATFPMAISLVAFTGWQQPLLVLCLIITLELFSNMVMEPLLYGHSVGISPVALITSAAFWTLLWGPIGLVLATPLTVCLVVLGQHVPQLRPVAVLLSDTPALPPPIHYYQRLLARDREEASRLVMRQRGQSHQLCRVFDTLLVPALLRVRRDRHREELSSEDANYVYTATREIIDELAVELEKSAGNLDDPRKNDVADASAHPEKTTDAGASQPTSDRSDTLNCAAVATTLAPDARQPSVPPILACPAHHEVEELLGKMLRCTMIERGVEITAASTRSLSKDLIEQIREKDTHTVFIAVMPPGGLTQAAYLCKEFRKAFPDLTIIVGSWGRKSRFDDILIKLRARGADYVTTSISQTQAQLLALVDHARQQQHKQQARREARCLES